MLHPQQLPVRLAVRLLTALQQRLHGRTSLLPGQAPLAPLLQVLFSVPARLLQPAVVAAALLAVQVSAQLQEQEGQACATKI